MKQRAQTSAESSADSEASRSLVAPALVLAIVIILLPTFYVLSIGPFVALEASGYIAVSENSPIIYFYWPLLWTAHTFEFAGTVFEWYVDLWDG